MLCLICKYISWYIFKSAVCCEKYEQIDIWTSICLCVYKVKFTWKNVLGLKWVSKVELRFVILQALTQKQERYEEKRKFFVSYHKNYDIKWMMFYNIILVDLKEYFLHLIYISIVINWLTVLPVRMDELGTVTVSFKACQLDVPKDIMCVAHQTSSN